MSSGIFNHVQIKVANLEHSRTFYDAIMNVLGHGIVLEIKDTVIGYGSNVHDMFEIRQADEKALLSQSVHIAVNAQDKSMVDFFYDVALKNGAHCNGKPGFRPQYEEGYYAAFVREPNGHNSEVVYSELQIK